MTDQPVRIAIIGAGLFATNTHLPALLAQLERFQIALVYSRTEVSARKLAEAIPYPVEISTDLNAVLSRDDIDAVDIVLPIAVMPEIVEKALRSGKHIISEKPIAPTVAIGKKMLQIPHAGLWMIAENWRYETVFVEAAKVVAEGRIGKPVQSSWQLLRNMSPASPYYQTTWRRDGSFPGGFLMDGGVHYVAALRLILGEITRVTATTRQFREDLPPADTMAATFTFDSGVTGTLSLTFAGASPFNNGLVIVGDAGSLRLNGTTLEIHTDGNTETLSRPYKGVEAELAAFANAIQNGQPHRNTPEQALQDVAIVEALLEAAASGNGVQPERFI